MTPKIVPSMTMSDVVRDGEGADHVLLLRASDRRSRWLPQDPLVRDGIASRALLLAGEMPVVAAEASVTPRVRALFDRAGVALADQVLTYRDPAEYRALLGRLQGGGTKILVQHVYPPDEIRSASYAVPPLALSWLNDKANLGEMAGDDIPIPRRRVVPGEWLESGEPLRELPFVLKVSTADSTGGGHDVAVCSEARDVQAARERFRGVERFVVEERLDIVRSFCVNFAVRASGEVIYIGAAEEVIRADGRHDGNWLDDQAPPPRVIDGVAAIMRRGAAMGFTGFAGVDVAIAEDGRALAIDLNFRLNASTPMILLADSIRARYGRRVMRGRRMHLRGSLEEMTPWLEREIDSGRLIPFSIYDTAASPFPHRPTFISGVILGDSREEVDALWIED